MIYESKNRRLESVKVTFNNEANTVMVCRDTASSAQQLYTVIAVKEHERVKELLEVFEAAEIRMKERVIDSFTRNGEFVMVFPYRQERLLADFYMGEAYSLTECEQISINLLVACLDCKLPWPILYLILRQGQISLAKDNEVYLGYQIDFTDFDPEKTEGDCAERAAMLLKRMLEPKESEKAISYRLLEKRIANESYEHFTDLYRDIRITAVTETKKGFFSKIRSMYYRNKDTLFGVLLRVSIVLALVALAAFVTQLIFGDVVWLSFFFNHFKVIGTESMYR